MGMKTHGGFERSSNPKVSQQLLELGFLLLRQSLGEAIAERDWACVWGCREQEGRKRRAGEQVHPWPRASLQVALAGLGREISRCL